RQRRRSVRSPLILAFSLLVAVGAAGLTLRLLGPPPPAVPPQEQHANIHGVAAIENPTPAGPISPAPAPGGSTHPSAPAITPGSGNDTAPTQPRAPGPGVSDLAVAPPPREANWDLFTAPLPPPVRISLAEVQPPFLRPLADFDRDEVAGTFLRQLQREPAVRIDVFTRDLHRGIQWLQKTAAQAGLHLFVDATTADRLKKNQPLTAVLLYCDGLTAEELTRLFLLLQAEDARISPRLFDMVHLMPLSPTDERELREVLGVDPQLGTKPRPERPEKAAAEVPQRPLSADTVDTIIQSLLNKGRIDKSALVTAWGPPAARVQPLHSAEIKAYLARRSTRPPRAVPALIIVRLPYS
ncbi:MAG: hypothetical protein NZ703_12880, partial [Gemmataceae bacterium]|nr:hypothetical protein [Gemmataceae bacterium]